MNGSDPSPKIGILNEKHLHAALKAWYARPGDPVEVRVDGYVIDIIQDGVLIEIQTGNFSSIKRKLIRLTTNHAVRLVYPIAFEKWILKPSSHFSEELARRKSPKRGCALDIFSQLVSFPALIQNKNFSIEVLMTQEEEFRRHVPGRAWRRKGWIIEERRLLDVVERHFFHNPIDFLELLPPSLPAAFTTTDLARTLKISRRLAQQAAYCLRKMDTIASIGKQNRSLLYQRIKTKKHH
jgi:hypothetical protein